MKWILKIQSISDIITNSSSEVFVMDYTDAKHFENIVPEDCIALTYIDWDYLQENVEELIADALNLNIPRDKYGWISSEDWDEALETFKSTFDQIIGYYLVDIEDHFPDCEDAYDAAKDVCLASEYRH